MFDVLEVWLPLHLLVNLVKLEGGCSCPFCSGSQRLGAGCLSSLHFVDFITKLVGFFDVAKMEFALKL